MDTVLLVFQANTKHNVLGLRSSDIDIFNLRRPDLVKALNDLHHSQRKYLKKALGMTT